jgi:predicted RNase H-like nuclease (RuvC/YqgF family)
MENLKNIKDLKEFASMVLQVVQENERLNTNIKYITNEREELKNRCNDLEEEINTLHKQKEIQRIEKSNQKTHIEHLQNEKEELENRCNDLEEHISKHLDYKETNQTNKVMEVKELLLKNLDLDGISYLIEESISLEVNESRFCIEVSKELDEDKVKNIIKNEIVSSFDAIVYDIEFETKKEKEGIDENY